MTRFNKSWAISFAATAVCGVTLSAAAVPSYTIKDLTPAGYSASAAFDINSDGDAVGVASTFASGSLVEHFFYYDHSAGTSTVFGVGTVSPAGSITGTGFREAAINDSGQVAGTAKFVGGSPQSRGFIYSGSTFTNLGTLYLGPGTGSNIRPGSDALDINASGLATGTASSGAATSDNVDVYTGSSAPITDLDGDLTALTKGDRGRAINNAGLVAGQNQSNKATTFSGMIETALLTGTAHGPDNTVAYDLNEVGQILIENSTDNDALIFDTTDSSVTVIPQIGTGNRMLPKGINEDADAVGWGDRSGGLSGQGRGWVYLDSDSTSYILEDVTTFTGSTTPGLGDWERLRTAWAINDDGWIVGEGDRRFTGESFPNKRAYLLVPVPEPSSAALLVLGAAALMRRRRG